MPDRYCVLGAGPAGLFAAWALIQSGKRVHIITDNPPMKPTAASAGVFVLHDPMGLPLPYQPMYQRHMGGNKYDYAQKVYGDRFTPTSFDPGREYLLQDMYDAARAIDLIWDILEPRPLDGTPCSEQAWLNSACTISQGRINKCWLHLEAERYAGVVSTIPLSIFVGADQCPWAPAWVVTSAAPADECYMLYNAHPDIPWYRTSAAFGRFTMEYAREPAAVKTYDGRASGAATKVRKVMPRYSTLPEAENTLFTGRFGAWDKSKLSHHAYTDTLEWLARR